MKESEEEWENVSLSIRIGSEEALDAHKISHELSLVPDNASNKGDRFPNQSTTRSRSVWRWSTEGKVTSTSMEEHAAFLISVLGPKKEALSKYLNDPTCDVSIWMDWQVNYFEGGYSLSSDTMHKLAELCKRIDFAVLIDYRED